MWREVSLTAFQYSCSDVWPALHRILDRLF